MSYAAERWQNRQDQLAMERDMEDRMMRGDWHPPSPVKPQPKPPEPVQLTAAQRATKDWDDRLKKAINRVVERLLAFNRKNNSIIEAEFEDVGNFLKNQQTQIDELRAEIAALRAEKRGWWW